ncbi:MAG: YdbL family protein [Desulfobacterales bacterium]|nr:YdbL family protein [Desulfobacterales bacterium]
MMKISRIVQTVLALGLVLAFVSGTQAFGGDIKARMRARLPDINALKAQGVIGENNRGFLEFVAAARDQEKVIQAENNDRQLVYRAIAQQQGTSAELVGQRRARQIAERAAPGEWLQDSEGKWYRK